MLVYHGFAAAALTDPALRASEMFTNGRGLIGFFATQLALIRTDDERRHLATADATGLLSLLLGLSIAVLLEQTTAGRSDRGVGRPPRPTHELTPRRPTPLTTVALGGVCHAKRPRRNAEMTCQLVALCFDANDPHRSGALLGRGVALGRRRGDRRRGQSRADRWHEVPDRFRVGPRAEGAIVEPAPSRPDDHVTRRPDRKRSSD